MAGTFIISFDCEGKWGISDCLKSKHKDILTNSKLFTAYKNITEILEDNEIRATFAFVGAYTLTIDEYLSHPEWFSDLGENRDRWLSAFKNAAQQNDFDGWLNPKVFNWIAKRQEHEIASHGFSHLPLGESEVTQSEFCQEMELIGQVEKLKKIEFKTFIYPRNLVGYVDQLRDYGFIGYRENLKRKYDNPLLKNICTLLGEFDLNPIPQSHPESEVPIQIPAGYFLNWRYRLRKTIPLEVTYKRWTNLISRAIRQNKVVHLWTHPNNFIDGENMYFLLDKILQFVGQAQKRGEIDVLTQSEYSTRRILLEKPPTRVESPQLSIKMENPSTYPLSS